MADRKAFLLRLDPKLHTAIERWAADELRSVNGQMEYLLKQAVMRRKTSNASEPESESG